VHDWAQDQRETFSCTKHRNVTFMLKQGNMEMGPLGQKCNKQQSLLYCNGPFAL
jgi:hypothetical protein